MTNREDDGTSSDPRVAAVLAVHLVGKVLDEAYDIALAAEESGHPLNYLSMLKNLRSDQLSGEELTTVTSRGDHETLNKSLDHDSNVATSTPQKSLDDSLKINPDSSFIGQGDGEFELQEELEKSTAVFINHLFDMSELERTVVCEDIDIPPNDATTDDLLTQAMHKIMDSYVNTAFNIACGEESQVNDTQYEGISLKNSEKSGNSNLSDAISGKGIAYYVENECISINEGKLVEVNVCVTEGAITKGDEEKASEQENKEDTARFENAYLTLNRDYDQEQGTDEEGDALVQDTKAMAMHDVELANTTRSIENLSINQEDQIQEEAKELAAISGVSAMSRKSKSSLVNRCRSTGARLLSCLRGWWRRKTPGKRRESRTQGSIRGLCPLSPEARQRAASLLDQRHLYSTPSNASAMWKFNTVNEAMVNSVKWNEYTFDMKPDPAEKLALEEYY